MRVWVLMEMRSRHEKRDGERAGVVEVADYKVVEELHGISCLYTLHGLINESILPGG